MWKYNHAVTRHLGLKSEQEGLVSQGGNACPQVPTGWALSALGLIKVLHGIATDTSLENTLSILFGFTAVTT
jgi:hypothetical protein